MFNCNIKSIHDNSLNKLFDNDKRYVCLNSISQPVNFLFMKLTTDIERI